MGVKLLGKIKICELSEQLGLTSKEIIEKANELGIEAKTKASSIDDTQAEKIRSAFSSTKEKVAGIKNNNTNIIT